jgi:DNA-binding SARP family transcriptional activator
MGGTTHTVSEFRIDLIDDFCLTAHDSVVHLPMGCQRLVALVALADRPIRRSRIAATLWPDTSEDRARANLRSALWRVSSVADVLVTSAWHVGLADGVAVDYRAEVAAFNRLNDSRHDIAHDLALAQEIGGRCGELLLDWGEDWVMVERERFRQIRLQTIDALGERLCESGRYRDALRVVLAGMAMDPLRESPHRLMVKAHLRLGNVADAIRQYRTYERLLDEELGVQPTRELTAMLAAG